MIDKMERRCFFSEIFLPFVIKNKTELLGLRACVAQGVPLGGIGEV